MAQEGAATPADCQSPLSSSPVRYVLRVAGILLTLTFLVVATTAVLGRSGAFAAISLSALAILYIWFWLPRLAHAAFEAGKFVVAARRYRWLERLAPSALRKRAARLSLSGCCVATNDIDGAERLLAAIDASQLAIAERAVWLNNRACAACAALAAKRNAADALALADEAGALRPDVPALQHTRAMALIEVGRYDDAIAILDAMRAGGELPPRLEAERCRELARAWTQKGHTAYAEDYRLRAESFSR
jgi:predicted Zn-dependent protease